MPRFRNINVNGVADELDERQSRLKSLSRVNPEPPRVRSIATRRGIDGSGISRPDGAAADVASAGFADADGEGSDGGEAETGGGAAVAFPEMTAMLRERQARASDETASRVILQTYLEDAGSETLREITAPASPQLVPDMQIEASGAAPDLGAHSIAYQQSAASVPVFGARVVVDIDAELKSLVTMNGKLSPVPTGSGVAKIAPAEAWDRLKGWAQTHGQALDGDPPAPPVLTWQVEEGSEHSVLVYHFAKVALAPPKEELPADLPFELPEHRGCVHEAKRAALYDYFIDAHDGSVRFYFASSSAFDIPVPMKGFDYDNRPCEFFGLSNGNLFLLKDPLRNIATYDYRAADLDENPSFPNQVIDHPTNDFGTSRPDAVCAHYNARMVYDFFNDVLKRDGIDDKGMQLVSVVNVYASKNNDLEPPEWPNAVWWNGKMWYGQRGGTSYAKHLDVIAHELTHGVTDTSSKLIYRRLSGALNESFSDIFGIAIANWWPGDPNPVSTWTWQIGPGLGRNGGPIRDFANPKAAGQPDHMNDYRELPISYDDGGVHIYSGIHNRAAHRLMTSTTPTGDEAFPIRELMLLLYLTLTRLTPTSIFTDSRRTLENIVRAYHASDLATRDTRLAAIDQAFGAVGIV